MKKPAPSRRNFIRNAALATGTFVILPAHVLGGRGRIAPSDTIGLGFIGTGKLVREGLFRRFIGIPGLRITAGCDVDRLKLADFKGRVEQAYIQDTSLPDQKGIGTFETHEALFGSGSVDAVVVATPDHWHALASIDAMKQGKDVYCEKPLTHGIAEGRALVNAATKYKRIVQTGSMQRSWKNFRHACELVVNGYLGKIKQVLVNVGDPAITCDLPGEGVPDYLDWDRWVGPADMRDYSPVLAPPITAEEWPRWRAYREFGGGGVCDWGAHMFDIVQWALEMDRSGPVAFTPPEDRGAVRGLRFTYDDGVEVVHEDFGRGWAVRFTGTEGRLDVSREFLDSVPENIATATIREGERHLTRSDDHYRNWIDAIRNRTLPVADAETGHRTATVCNIINMAYRLGRPLRWDPVREMFPGDDQANELCKTVHRQAYRI